MPCALKYVWSAYSPLLTDMKNCSTPVAILKNVISLIGRAQTISYEATKLHPTNFPWRTALNSPRFDFGRHAPFGKEPRVRQKYFFLRDGPSVLVRVESELIGDIAGFTTLFIKNREGIWRILPNQICEVSNVFQEDQLYGTFPFFRLLAITRHQYEMAVIEDGDAWVLHGTLECKPKNESDISTEFLYVIEKKNGLLRLLNERTFGGGAIHLKFERLKFGGSVDPKIFKLPMRPKIYSQSLSDYAYLRESSLAK